MQPLAQTIYESQPLSKKFSNIPENYSTPPENFATTLVIFQLDPLNISQVLNSPEISQPHLKILNRPHENFSTLPNESQPGAPNRGGVGGVPTPPEF